jgi:hypothetical protein
MVSIKLLTATVVLVLLQLGLAVLGWGVLSPFFANPARAALAVATVVLTIVALFSGGNLSPGEEEDRSNREGDLSRSANCGNSRRWLLRILSQIGVQIIPRLRTCGEEVLRGFIDRWIVQTSSLQTKNIGSSFDLNRHLAAALLAKAALDPPCRCFRQPRDSAAPHVTASKPSGPPGSPHRRCHWPVGNLYSGSSA